MSVAAPVLERNTETKEREYTREYNEVYMTAEEKHNSLISENYAKLINPESKLKDIIDRTPTHSVADEVEPESVYLVENARADADIFRADSAINRIKAAAATSQNDEEENEDLRPTQTTIQYKTSGVATTVEEGKIDVRPQTKSFGLTKKDKIIIAVALSVIVALFVLIIVNSAIISNLNSEVSSLQSTLIEAESGLEEVSSAKQAFLDEDNLIQVVNEFAIQNGMELR